MTIYNYEESFLKTKAFLFEKLASDEKLSLEFSGEASQFLRFNSSKVRQSGVVDDGTLRLALVKGKRTVTADIGFTGDIEQDLKTSVTLLVNLQSEVATLPDDPYCVPPKNGDSSRTVRKGNLLSPEDASLRIAEAIQGMNLTGFYQAGTVYRALANSEGVLHWFETATFAFQYSLFHSTGKAVTRLYAGTNWDDDAFAKNLKSARENVVALDKPMQEIPPGEYRAYLAPAAVADLVSMFGWHGLSEGELRRGESAFIRLRSGEHFSPAVTFTEDFSSGAVPRFNGLGELAPEKLTLIENGELKNTFISSRTALEYGIKSNGATVDETPRSFSMAPGSLDEAEILKSLGTGFYLSNLHYLNWSDTPNARITGMTRFACFWVEDGQIKGPIKDMRFDASFYEFFGTNLEGLTKQTEFAPETGTYFRRSVGAVSNPGALFKSFHFTL